MSETYYTREHEWVRVADGVAAFGITEHAQEQLGDVVFVDLPDVGRSVAKGDETASIESVKAASEVYAPLSGEIVEVNSSLADAPQTVNESAESEGWFAKIRLSDPSELEALMDADAYAAFVAA